MPTGFVGLDPKEMKSLAADLSAAAQETKAALSDLEGRAKAMQWEGPDADRFRSTSWPPVAEQLTSLIGDFQSAAQIVEQNLAAQQQVSAT